VKNIISGQSSNASIVHHATRWHIGRVSSTVASSHAAIPRMIMMIKTSQNCFPAVLLLQRGNSPDINSKDCAGINGANLSGLVQQQSGSLNHKSKGCTLAERMRGREIGSARRSIIQPVDTERCIFIAVRKSWTRPRICSATPEDRKRNQPRTHISASCNKQFLHEPRCAPSLTDFRGDHERRRQKT